MIAVDANALVRLLISDPDSQAQVRLAKALLKRAKQVYVPQIVQIRSSPLLHQFLDRDSFWLMTFALPKWR